MPNSMAKRTLTNNPKSKLVEAAEIANFKAETALLQAKTRGEDLENGIKPLKLEEFTTKASSLRNHDSNRRVYDISTDIVPQQVNTCVQQLSIWERVSP